MSKIRFLEKDKEPTVQETEPTVQETWMGSTSQEQEEEETIVIREFTCLFD